MQLLFKTDNVFASLVDEITAYIDEEIIITNENGIIVASTDQTRIGNYHEGAFLAMKKQKKMIMTEELCKKLEGVRKGIVLPITIKESPIGVLGITGDPLKVEPYARIVQRMAELFISETIAQMTEEKISRNLELFVFDWINGNVSQNILTERSKFFNINLSVYRQIICIEILSSPMENLSYKELLSLKRIWDQNQDAIFVRWGQGKLIIVDVGYSKQQLLKKINNFLLKTKNKFGDDVYVGVGKETDYLNIRTSYEQAERSCFVAKKENRIVFEEELRLEMLQYSIDQKTKRHFIERTVAPIIAEETLLGTLKCWLGNNMSINKTAEELFIHKNTLYYRLQKIEEKTNMNLNDTEHIVLFYLGLKFYDELSI